MGPGAAKAFTACLLLVCALPGVPESRAASPPPAPPPNDAWTGRAVLVGVPYYPGSTEPLEYANNDARDLRAALLLDPAHWQSENIALLVGGASTAQAIEAAVRAMGAAAAPGDVCLFSYAGHGGQYPDSSPVDEADGLDEYLSTSTAWVCDDEIAEWFAAFESRNICLVIDSCRSGGISRSLTPGDSSAEDCAIGLGDDIARVVDPTSGARAVGDGPADGPVLLAASSEAGSSYTSVALANGIFTFFVAEALWQPEADANRDGIVSAQEVFAYAAPRAADYSPGQTPVLVDLHEGELPLANAATRDFGALEDTVFGGGACSAPSEDPDAGGGATAFVIALVLAGVISFRRSMRAAGATFLTLALAGGCSSATAARASVPVVDESGPDPAPKATTPARGPRRPFARIELAWPVGERNASYGPGIGAGAFVSWGAARRYELGGDAIFIRSREVDMTETLLAGRLDLLWRARPVAASREAYLLTGGRVFFGTARARWGEVWEIAGSARLGFGWRSVASPLDLRVTLDFLVGSENAPVLFGLAAGFGF